MNGLGIIVLFSLLRTIATATLTDDNIMMLKIMAGIAAAIAMLTVFATLRNAFTTSDASDTTVKSTRARIGGV